MEDKIKVLQALQSSKSLKNQEDILKALSTKKDNSVKIDFPVTLTGVKFDNLEIPEGLLDGVRTDLKGVINTLRIEINKLDRKIEIPKQEKQDNSDIVKSLKKIEDKIKEAEYPEMIDYTTQLKELSSKISPTDTSKIEKILKEIKTNLPKEKDIFEDITSKSPLAVMLIDSNGKRVSKFGSGGDMTAPSIVALRVGTTTVDENNPLPVNFDGFMIPKFDTQVIDESITGTTTITYSLSGETVATKTIIVVGSITTISVI